MIRTDMDVLSFLEIEKLKKINRKKDQELSSVKNRLTALTMKNQELKTELEKKNATKAALGIIKLYCFIIMEYCNCFIDISTTV